MTQALFTLLLSGVVAAIVSFVLGIKKDQFVFKQRKAEELYLAADRYIKDLFGSFVYYYPFHKGEGTRQEAVIAFLESNKGKAANSSHPTLWMLVKFYFPELLPQLQALDDARSAVTALTGKKSKPNFSAFDAATGAFNDRSEELLAAIVGQGQRYAEMSPFSTLVEEFRARMRSFRSQPR